MAYKIQIRRDTATNWTSVNPTLAQGELGYETTTGKLKVGDGAKTWAQLDYLIGENDGSIDLGAVDKHVLPATDNVYDLGSPTKQWRELYVSGGSIYVGDIKISNQEGRLIFTQVTNPGQINEAPVPGGTEAFELPIASDTLLGAVKIGDNLTITEDGTLNAQQGDYELPTASNIVKGGVLIGDNLSIDGEGYLSAVIPEITSSTGDVTFEGVKVIGAGTASGDGNGYSTLELVPDNNLYNNQQYLVIDPTAPSHIHIRAGGAQDDSNAELYLGGEKNNVRVRDGDGVRLYNETSFSDQNTYNSGEAFTSGTWTAGAEGQNSALSFTTTDQLLIDSGFNVFNDNRNILEVTTSEGTYTLTPQGFGGTGDVYTFNIQEQPTPTPQTVLSISLTLYTVRNNTLSLEGNDFTVNVSDDIRITGSDIVSIRNNSTTEPITIITNYDNSEYRWEFMADGSTYLPSNQNSQVSYLNSSLNDTVVKLSLGGGNGVEIVADSFSGSSTKWEFGVDGSITFPDGGSLRVGQVPGTSLGATGDKQGTVAFDSTHIYYCIADYNQLGHQVTVATDYLGNTELNTNLFQLTKTADTLQITAGDIISDGDGGATSVVESVTSDENYTYVSTGSLAYAAIFPLTFTSTNYVPGGNIWKRVSWSNDTW